MRWIGVMLFLICAIDSFAQKLPDPILEVGLAVGEPTGVSAKYWITDRNAFDAGAGWSSKRKLLDVYLDYQYHYFWSDFDGGNLPLFVGGGAMARLNKNFNIGLRLPIGAEYLFEGPRLVAFAQVAPTVKLIPKLDAFVSGGLGIRYAF